ncbi:MAG: RNA polymerase sigma factor [Actinobacteria bacterium]|nr:RNA polymerase sigma factor [Actinomycetota bacterium]
MALRADDVNLRRDRALVESFQSGDSRAFEDLYRRYFQRVYRFCLKRVGDPHEAEELAQEAFSRAYSAMPRLTGERRFYPWLTVIASRLCVDHHRRSSRVTPSDTVELGVVDGGQQAIVDQVDRDLLAAAMARMVPRHREVLQLREEEGWSYERIAGHFGVRVGTIDALIFRARKALRREFTALAGPDSRLAGLPVAGYLLRRMASLRHRFDGVAGQAVPMLAAGAMSIAVVVGSVAAGGSGDASRQAHTNAPAPAVVQMPAYAAGSIAPPVASAANTAGTAGAAQAVPHTDDLVLRNAGQFGVTTPDDARRQANNMPFQAEFGPVQVGLDPAALTEPLLP